MTPRVVQLCHRRQNCTIKADPFSLGVPACQGLNVFLKVKYGCMARRNIRILHKNFSTDQIEARSEAEMRKEEEDNEDLQTRITDKKLKSLTILVTTAVSVVTLSLGLAIIHLSLTCRRKRAPTNLERLSLDREDQHRPDSKNVSFDTFHQTESFLLPQFHDLEVKQSPFLLRNSQSHQLLLTASSSEEEADSQSVSVQLTPDVDMEPGNFDSKYKICDGENVVGSGSFGFVFRYINQQTQEDVAVKIFGQAEKNYPRIRKELELWKNLSHDNIVPVLDFCIDIKSGVRAVMPLSRGNLRDFIEENCDETLESKQLFDMSRMLLDGLSHLHHKKIIHRDLKPENILHYKDRGKLNLKIADFSIAKALEGTENTATFNAGTKRWMAPEILLGLEKTKKYSFKVDIWSLGLVLHDLITGGGYLGFTRPPDNWFLIRNDEDIETIEVGIEKIYPDLGWVEIFITFSFLLQIV